MIGCHERRNGQSNIVGRDPKRPLKDEKEFAKQTRVRCEGGIREGISGVEHIEKGQKHKTTLL